MKIKALIVDDQESVVHSIQHGLPDYDWTPVTSGEQALEHLFREKFDVLVTDVRMPGIDGIELLKRVNKMDSEGVTNPYMAKVVLTGYDDSEALALNLNERGTYRVGKPWGDELEVTLKRAVEYSELVKEKEQFKKEKTTQEHNGHKSKKLENQVAKTVHELNNPLAGISGYIEMIMSKTDDGEISDKLRIVRNETERCRKIVQDLLSYSKTQDLKKESFNLNSVLESSIDCVLQEVGDVGHIKIIKQFHKPEVSMLGDPILFQGVFINLIKNSLQAMIEQKIGDQLRIFTEIEKEGYLKISFLDNGHGIQRKDLEKIFEPYFSKRGKKGTGLGLAIVKEIIEAHGGSISVSNEKNGGANFSILVPQ